LRFSRRIGSKLGGIGFPLALDRRSAGLDRIGVIILAGIVFADLILRCLCLRTVERIAGFFGGGSGGGCCGWNRRRSGRRIGLSTTLKRKCNRGEDKGLAARHGGSSTRTAA